MLPCPFCGSQRVAVAPCETNSRVKAVFCGERHAEGSARSKASDAVALWNERKTPDKVKP